MPSPTIVIAQSDPAIAQGLAKDLHAYFARVAVAQSATELRALLLRHEARIAVLDLELVNIDELRKLAGNYSDLLIVGTHRSPDEQMWMQALNAGAAEFCHPQDLHCILHATHVASAPPRNMDIAA